MSRRLCRLKRLGSFIFILLLSVSMFSILFASLQYGLLSRVNSVAGSVGSWNLYEGSETGVQESSGNGNYGAPYGIALEAGNAGFITYSSSPVDWWTMFRHDLARTGYSTSTGPGTNQTGWTYQTAGAVRSSPSVFNGVVYVGSIGGNVYALDASTGAKIWSYATGGDIFSSPAVVNGVVYVGSNDWNMYALNASTGTKIWSYNTGGGVFSCPAVVSGVIYVGSTDNHMYALDASTGTQIWNYSAGNQIRASPAIVNGVMYIASEDGNVYALEAATGAKIWSSPTSPGDSYVCSSPTVANGVVYVGAWNGAVYALDASTGAQIWNYSTGSIVESSPSIANNVVYVGSDDGNVYALNAATGAKIWSYTTNAAVYSSPAVAGGVVYVGGWDGAVYALDASTGAKKWSYATGGTIFSSPAIANGVLYIGSYDGKVYALGTPSPVHELSVGVDGQGITNTTGTNMYIAGSTVSVQAFSNLGWALSSWLLNGTNVGSSNPYTLTMNANYDLTAVFEVSPSQWPMFHHDVQHTGYSNSARANANYKLWNYTTGGPIASSPAVVDGRVYVGSYDNETYCLNASTGALIWRFATGGQIYSSPAVIDGRLYIGSFDSKIYCLDASTGTLIWNYTTGGAIWSSPAIVDGRVYVGSYDNETYCLDALTGTKIWSYTLNGQVVSSPAVAYGNVYVGSIHFSIYCLDALTGTKVWNYTTLGGSIDSSPTIADGRVFAGSMPHDNTSYCWNASTGDKLWSYTTGGWMESTAAVAYGNVYVGSGDGNIYCLNESTGSQIWNSTTGSSIDSSPAVADNQVYVGSTDNKTYCFDAGDGRQIWNYTTNGPIGSTPVIVDGKIYVGSGDGNVYCLGSNQYGLTVNVSGQGTTNATGTTFYDSGSLVSVVATPSNGWTLSYWLLDGSNVGSANPYPVALEKDTNLTAVFSEISPIQYELLVEVSGSGTTNVTGSHIYDSGSVISVQATPNSDWMLNQWLLNGSNVGSANPYTLTLSANYNLTAVFSETSPVQYELLIGVSGSGTTNVTGSHIYDSGSLISVQAFPSTGWVLSGWLLDGSNAGSVNPYTVDLEQDTNLTAVFSEIPPIQYRLLVVVNGQGSTNTTGISMHNAGSVVSVQASPDVGCILNGWLLNGSSAGASDPFTVAMNASYNLTAVFTRSSATASPPLFTILNEQVAEYSGGINLSYTFRNHNSSAVNGSVWIPREQILCTVPLTKSTSGSVSGNLSEAELQYDANGDGDTNDVFVVNYVDNATVQINGTTAHAQLPPGRRTVFPTPDGYGIYYTYDKASFQLGSKNLTLYSVSYSTEDNTGYAELGLDSTFQYYPSPCLQLIIEQPSISMDSTPPAEIASMNLNGTAIAVASNYTESLTGELGEQWIAERVYVYPMGSLQQNDAFTVDLSIKGEVGTYELMAVLDWSPDAINRYAYPNFDLFAITGSVHEAIQFGASTYPVEVLTNSTILQSTVYNWTAKTLSFNVTGFGGFSHFCNVTIPKSLLQGNPWAVDVDGSPTSFVAASNSTHSFLYFDLNATALPPQFFTSLVTIKGTLGVADTTPPHVSAMWTDPSGTIPPMTDVRVYVNATDAGTGVKNATLYYSTGNESSWLAQLMVYNDSTGYYEAVIPAQQTGTQVKFKVVVFNNAENNVTMESEYPVQADVWAPSAQGAAIAAVISVGTVAVASTLASTSSAAGSSAAGGASKLGEKLHDLLPSTVKKWLADAISSKHKVEIGERSGHPLILTRIEVLTYAVTTLILTVAFAYAETPSLGQILEAMPMILVTSILIDFVKTYIVTAVSRHSGVWAEHRLWYVGMGLFAFSTLVFRVPFSSPSRLYHYSPKMTKRTGGLLSTLSILIAWAFAAVFLVLLVIGFRLVGSVGLVMCLTMAFFDTIPIPPMGGKGIYSWNKVVWLGLFAVSLSSYTLSLILL